MSSLTAFQDAFSEALSGESQSLSLWLPTANSAGLRVYRNTVAKGLADALAASFPTVQRLVGEDWFEAAAVEFSRHLPPLTPSLLAYGKGFAQWLAAFEPAQSLPYLPGIARLDRLWTEAHLAADAEPMGGATLTRLGGGDLEATGVVLHPTARFAWFEDNTPSLWLSNRPPAVPPDEFAFETGGQGVLITRPEGEVQTELLDAPSYAFVRACAEGCTLASAAAQALNVLSEADLSATVQCCLRAGVFTEVRKQEPQP